MALTESEPIELGTKAPDFALPAAEGGTLRLSDCEATHGLVVMFICNHCPYVIAIEARLVELANDYASKGVGFVAIMSNDVARYPADGPDKMREKGYPFPYLYDESQEVAKAYGAVCTPDLFVFDSGLQLAYHGRLDDSWKDPAAVTRRDLRLALDSLLAGESPSAEQIPSMGCSIKWK